MKGWVKIHRSMLKWEWWDDHNTARLWLYLLLTAAHEDVRFRGKVIKRGQLVTTLVKISEDTGISVQSVRTSLARLISTNEITSISTNKYRLITICKYEDYQVLEEETNKQINNPTNNQLTNNQQTTNKHKEQELKNNIYITHSVNARTCEGNGWEDNYFLEAYGNAVWREFVRMRTLLSEDDLNDALKMFQMECRCREKTHISHADWKSHFFDWLLKTLKSNKQNNGTNKKCFTIDEIDAIVQAGIGNADTERR
jgi:hypothetical protein